MNAQFDDLSSFFDLAAFGEECRRDGELIGVVILSTPDQEVLGGSVITGDAMIEGASAEIGVLADGDLISVGDENFEVRGSPVRTDDGLTSNVFLVRRT